MAVKRILSHQLKTSTANVIQGRIKMAQLFSMSEKSFDDLLKELEKSPVFNSLKLTGVLSIAESSARIAARNFAGYGVKLSSGGGIPELIDGNCDLVKLIQSIGQEKFEALFLKDAVLTDVERSEECDITVKEAEKLREFVDRTFIQAEFEQKAPTHAPEQVFSSVASIDIENGKPVLAFFNRDIWKSQYKVNQNKLSEYLSSVSGKEADKIQGVLKQLEFVEQRKTTLYKLLETLLEMQAEYFITGDPAKRKGI